MCAPAIVMGVISAVAAIGGIGASIYSANQQKKAADNQTRAIQQLSQTKTKVADQTSKTATAAKVNDTPQAKRGLSSLRIPTNYANTVNMADTSTGLNIPT